MEVVESNRLAILTPERRRRLAIVVARKRTAKRLAQRLGSGARCLENSQGHVLAVSHIPERPVAAPVGLGSWIGVRKSILPYPDPGLRWLCTKGFRGGRPTPTLGLSSSPSGGAKLRWLERRRSGLATVHPRGRGGDLHLTRRHAVEPGVGGARRVDARRHNDEVTPAEDLTPNLTARVDGSIHLVQQVRLGAARPVVRGPMSQGRRECQVRPLLRVVDVDGGNVVGQDHGDTTLGVLLEPGQQLCRRCGACLERSPGGPAEHGAQDRVVRLLRAR